MVGACTYQNQASAFHDENEETAAEQVTTVHLPLRGGKRLSAAQEGWRERKGKGIGIRVVKLHEPWHRSFVLWIPTFSPCSLAAATGGACGDECRRAARGWKGLVSQGIGVRPIRYRNVSALSQLARPQGVAS